MSIGTGVVLFVIGAILAFAVNIQVDWADLTLIGYILMGAGVIVFLVGIILMARRRTTNVVTRTEGTADGGTATRRTVRESGSGDEVL